MKRITVELLKERVEYLHTREKEEAAKENWSRADEFLIRQMEVQALMRMAEGR